LGGPLFEGGVLPAQYCPCGLYTLVERRRPVPIPLLASQSANISHRPGGRLPLSPQPSGIIALKPVRNNTAWRHRRTGVNNLPKVSTHQRPTESRATDLYYFYLPCESRKTAPFYFCNNFVRPSSTLIFLAHIYRSKFPISSIFLILYKVESREPA